MSKSHIEAFVKAQYNALLSKDNKDRLRYIVAGCKDGRLYSNTGTDYGEIDAPDTVFSESTDLDLSRVTTVKLNTINDKMLAFFAEYGANPVEEVTEPEEVTLAEKCENTFAIEDAVTKAIKKGKFKKAQKLIDRVDGDAKLQKKLDKAIKNV